MLFYFSGTGNTRWVAEFLAQELNDRLRFIPDEIGGDMHYVLKDGERLGFVFPCYGWGVPPFVERFIEQVKIDNVDYLYFVTTCGDDTGLTAEIFCDDVEQKGWSCNLGYAVQMPESYVCLPGFDVDPKEKEQQKLISAITRMNQIVDDVLDKRGGFDTIPGGFAWVKSRIIRPFFNRFLVSAKYFKTNGACVGCGKCVQACPYQNIQLNHNNQPEWSNTCVQCLHCYHQCPVHAIEWGVFTKNKGQYLFKSPLSHT